MTQSVTASMFEDAGFQPRFSKCTLQDRFVQMMPALLAGKAIYKMIRCRKNPLPTPFLTGIGIFALKRVRQSNTSYTSFEVGLMLGFNESEVLQKRLSDCSWQGRMAVFVPFSGTNHDFVLRKVDIFYAQAAAFYEAQPSTIEH